jgi:microcystin-dependent protein
MNIKKIVSAAVVASTLGFIPFTNAFADEPFIGEIMWVGYNFCPRGWADADGQILPISENAALFSLYGTQYGGDGRIDFALPDLRGRVSVHTSISYAMGSTGGEEETTLSVDQMPSHNHMINASGGAISKNAAGSILGSPGKKMYDAPMNATTTLDSTAVSATGGSAIHENRPPYLTLRACVALAGIYPSRD